MGQVIKGNVVKVIAAFDKDLNIKWFTGPQKRSNRNRRGFCWLFLLHIKVGFSLLENLKTTSDH